jgi:1-acyl-sn-glycerol-3-phosphate acyltransferase
MKTLRQSIGRTCLSLFGWRCVSALDFPPKFVMIAAPHTSNWDFPPMVATAWSIGVSLRWLGKVTLFAPLLGPLFRRLGGIPVDRNAQPIS